jgi:hypothetical protein
MEQYKTCLLQKSSLNLDDPDCIGKCQPNCEQWSFKIASSYYSSHVGVALNLQITNMNYPIFEENLKWTLESFLGEIGGVVGFLLSFTLMDVVQVLYSFFVHIISFLLKKVTKYRKARVTVVQSFSQQIEEEVDESAPHSLAFIKRTLPWHRTDSKNSLQLHIFQWIVLNIFSFLTILIFGYLTITNGVDLFRQYQQQKSTFNIHYLSNKSIALPISTFCIQLDPVEFDEFKKKVDAPMLKGTEYQDEIESYFNQSKMTKEFFLNDGNLTSTLLFLVYRYLAALTRMETSSSVDYIIQLSTITTMPQVFLEEENPGSKDIYLALMMMENRLRNLGVTTNDLRQLFGRHVSEIFSLRATQITETDNGRDVIYNETVIPLNQVTIVSDSNICYQIRFDMYPFHENLQETIILTAQQFNDSLPTLQGYYYNWRHYYLDFSQENLTGIDPNTFDYSVNYFTSNFDFKIGIDAVYQSLPSAQCSPKITFENCLADCRVVLIRKLCSCTPTSWSQNYDKSSLEMYPECRINDYISCLSYTQNDTIDCTSNCVGLCDRVSSRYYDNNINYTTDGSMRIEITVVDFDYVSFEEVPKWSFDSITGAIGGIFCIYLGLSFWRILKYLVAAIALMATTITRWMQKK